MPIKVIINGAKGKMGSLASLALEQDARFEVVGKVGRGDDLAHTIRQTHAVVVLDLTRADVVFQNAQIIIEAGARPVIGTSGLTDAERATLTTQCERQGLGGLIVPNFSLGMLLMMLFAKQAARFFPDVEIIEMHHAEKQDAPSATAIKTAQMIAAGRRQQPQAIERTVSTSRGARYEGVPIHALRLPGILATQSVIFGGEGEQLTLRHESTTRQSFMRGVLLACEKVITLTSLHYGLEQVMRLEKEQA